MLRLSSKGVISILIIVYLVVAPAFLVPQIKEQAEYLNRENKIDYYGVLELWNVDTFEGGSVARSLWLERRAMEFEKNNPGTFILVRNMTKEQAITNLQNGNKPTLISYGVGFGSVILNELTNYTGTVEVRDDLLKGGMLNGSIYAVPYLLGGYALIANDALLQKVNIANDVNLVNYAFEATIEGRKTVTPSLSFAGNANTNAPLALYLNTNKVLKEEKALSTYALELDPYVAYENFVLKFGSTMFIGTQRDVYRTKNRMANNSDEAYSYNYLGGFSDLVQYMSIFHSDNKTKLKCEEFIAYLTSEKVQRTITNIHMFSVLTMHIYNDIFYKEWEKELLKPLKTTNLFLEDEVIKDNFQVALSALKGNTQAKDKINDWF